MTRSFAALIPLIPRYTLSTLDSVPPLRGLLLSIVRRSKLTPGPSQYLLYTTSWLVFWEMGNELLIGTKYVLPTPIFVIFVSTRFLDLRTSHKRASFSLIDWLSRACLVPHYGVSSERLLLAAKVHISGARGVFLSLPHSLAQTAWRSHIAHRR